MIFIFTVIFSAFILIMIMHLNAKKLTITEEVINFPIAMKTKNILFISDIHRRQINGDIVDSFPAIDFVIIGGDLAEKGVKESLLKDNLTILCKRSKVYFVWGNNDYEFGKQRLEGILKDFQVQLLENSAEVFTENEECWSIVGVEDYGTSHADVYEALKHAKGPILFISHNPSIAAEIKGNHNIVAIISGHTHGGQIRIGPLGIAESGGWKRKNNLDVFISNGFGTRSLPLRLGADPQIHLVTIKGVEGK